MRELFLLVNIFFMAAPLLFMILSATKTNDEFLTKPFALPGAFPKTMIENLKAVVSGKITFYGLGGETTQISMFTPFFKMFFNTSVLTVLSLIGMLLAGLLFGYALGTKRFRGKTAVIFFVLIIQTVPFFGYITPMYLVTDRIGLNGRLLGVVPVYIAVSLPMAIILFHGFFKSFPKAVEEAALIDGCGEIRKFISIVVPLSASALVSLAVINFMGFWNEFAIANLMIGPVTNLRTINIGIMMSYSQVGVSYFYYAFMLLTLSAIPNFIFFTIFQRKIMKGVSLGAIKG